jgi:integrase
MTRGFTLPSEGEAHTLYLTQTQRDQMFALCEGILSADWDRHWRAAGAVCLALGTAARQEAILTLKWSQVDFDAGVIDYREPDRVVSNKRRVAVPMSEEVRKVLKLLEKKTGASKSGLVLGHAGTVRSGFDRIRHQTGVPWCRFRTLRTTWASLAAQRGVDLFIIGEVLGDDIETVRKHYAHLHPTHLRSAFQ